MCRKRARVAFCAQGKYMTVRQGGLRTKHGRIRSVTRFEDGIYEENPDVERPRDTFHLLEAGGRASLSSPPTRSFRCPVSHSLTHHLMSETRRNATVVAVAPPPSPSLPRVVPRVCRQTPVPVTAPVPVLPTPLPVAVPPVPAPDTPAPVRSLIRAVTSKRLRRD